MTDAKLSSSGYADANDTKLYYEVDGEGHPLVLIHGGLVDNRSWDDQFHAFAQHYKVIRYDLRGYGKSVLPSQTYAPYEDVYSLLKFLGIEKTYVLGLSLGGGIAIDFTLAYPEIVDALIPVASGVGGYKLSEENQVLIAEVDAALESGDLVQAAELENRIWTDGPERTPEQVNPSVRERVREMNMHNYSLTLDKDIPSTQKLDPPALSRLSEIHVPTLIIVGDKDISDMLVIAVKLEAGIAGAKKVVIPGVAHALNMEKPEEFNRIVLDFLGKL